MNKDDDKYDARNTPYFKVNLLSSSEIYAENDIFTVDLIRNNEIISTIVSKSPLEIMNKYSMSRDDLYFILRDEIGMVNALIFAAFRKGEFKNGNQTQEMDSSNAYEEGCAS